MRETSWHSRLTNVFDKLVAFPAAGMVIALALWLQGWIAAAEGVLIAFTLPVLLALLLEIAGSLRRGEFGLDILAALSMSAALLSGEVLAAAVVSLMYAGGQRLEAYAAKQARREMNALLARVPRTSVRYHEGRLQEVAIEAIMPTDRLMIRRGDVVPVDGTLAGDLAVLDQSALTGEALPVQRRLGQEILSGASNIGEAFDLIALRSAKESTFAGIIRLVEAAQRSKAPMVRMADRFALVFLVLALSLAGLSWWISGSARTMVAVLVVATPCPLILAVPVAIVSGLSRAAKHGILIKGGEILERLGRIQSIVIDKTGTLTKGRARLVSILPTSGIEQTELLRLAASLDQASKHVVAHALVDEALTRGLLLSIPLQVKEAPGEGVEGVVDGHRVIVGGLSYVRSKLTQDEMVAVSSQPGVVVVNVALDGRMAGTLLLADELRSGVAELLNELRRLGVGRIVLATGDHREAAAIASGGLAFDTVRSELTPDQKVLVVVAERKFGPVLMVGDGVNDAPALAAADVGIAMGEQGSAASVEIADAVLLTSDLSRITSAIDIAQRTRGIALQSVIAGIGLSTIGMIAAALGYLQPIEGALLQEAIDFAVVVNALRVLRLQFGGKSDDAARLAIPLAGSVSQAR